MREAASTVEVFNDDDRPSLRSHITLGLCTILHAFTHAYGTMLVPLYLLIAADLHLNGVKRASLIVTAYGLVYCLGSFAAGIFADRYDRRLLLGAGLLGNALAITLMGVTRRYEIVVAMGLVGGLFGSMFHPAASALVPAHYPKTPGMAIGILGIGAGIGFFLGPQYAGMRAGAGSWHIGDMADWQRPCIELGVAGLVVGVLFLLIAREVRKPLQTLASSTTASPPKSAAALGAPLRLRVVAVATTLAARDFAGVATISLVSLYLQKAHRLDVKSTGIIVGSMMLISVIANPLSVWLSPGGRRLPTLIVLLLCSAAIIATVPLWPVKWALLVLAAFQACHLGSYAISDAAILERVSPAVRGRVVGLFLTIAGTIASSAPWIIGYWTDALGPRSRDATSYFGPFGLIAAMMALATLSGWTIARLGAVEPGRTADPRSAIAPATMEPLG